MAEQPRVQVIPSEFMWIATTDADPVPVAMSVAKDELSGAARLHIFTAGVKPVHLGTLHVPRENIEDLVGFLRHGNEAPG